MSCFRSAWNCIFSPRLIQIYGASGERSYEPHTLEKWSDQVISSIYMMWKIGVYASPIWGVVLYNRGYFEPQGLALIMKFVAGVGAILIVSFCFRGVSRAGNPTYMKFLDVLQQAKNNVGQHKRELMKYDFDFTAWPVEYDLSGSNKLSRKITKRAVEECSLLSLPFQVLAYFAVHTFGIRMIYPGTVGLLQMVLENGLIQGRTRLIDLYAGERFKLKSVDGNSVDTMVVDRRHTHSNGDTLVICCEGNAGFYEIGTMVTPIEAGYSVLGWNHPGFGGSTGMPYPPQEQNAMDAVIQFAINKLGFKPQDIILFGWSIGGYSVSWAAMTYPDIKAVVIDATFDDILPLAMSHMPGWWGKVVKIAIRHYVDLNIFEQLVKYPGPLLLIRRTKDEVICLEQGNLASNRGNDLLIKILRYRYPCVFEDIQVQILREYLAVTGTNQERVLEKYSVDDSVCLSLLQSYISEYSKSYPMKIGEEFGIGEKNQMALFLAKKYMKDFKATHCVSLPWDMFTTPWDVSVESDFVFT